MTYKISELADKAGVTKRTIHYYISKGLLLPPEGMGVNSLYNDNHLERINIIKSLQENYMPLEKIREQIVNNPGGNIKTSCEMPKQVINEDVIDKNNMYIKEDICDIFEIHCSVYNSEKYKYIIDNVRDYVRKMKGE